LTVRWGVIGAGGIAARRTIPEGLAASDVCDLVAVMDPRRERACAIAEKYGVPDCVYTVGELLAIPEVEAVYIASPNIYHKDQAIAAARAGKHVLVEKPMALTLADGQAMVDACAAAGVKLMVGYMMRFHAHHQWLKAQIDAGALGQPVFGRAQLTCWYPDIEGAWRQDPILGGGGAFIDMGTHCLDLLEMFLGRVRRLTAVMGTLTHGYPVEDSATLLLEFESGARGLVDANFNIPDEASQNVLEVRGTKGAVYADHTIGQDAGGHMTAYLLGEAGGYDAAQVRTGSIAEEVCVTPINCYRAEVEHFVDCIEQDRTPITDGREGLRNLALTLLAYESARTGNSVLAQPV
jgi:predicted dehydrogenase